MSNYLTNLEASPETNAAPTFIGGDGKALIGLGSGWVGSIVVPPDGKVLVGGSVDGSGTLGYELTVQLLLRDGTLYAGFGTRGKLSLNLLRFR